MPLIKQYEQGYSIEIDRGAIDNWCVYIGEPNGRRHAPTDMENFERLKTLTQIYDQKVLYEHFVQIYDLAGKTLNVAALNKIDDIARLYVKDELEVNILFTVLYLAMIAEENRAHTRLGKRIKRLGVYILLVENGSCEEAANCMRGMSWRAIDAMCKERGF